MMTVSASWALQRAMFQSLVVAPGVLSALGGSAVYDRVPRQVRRPYVSFGPTNAIDRSTTASSGEEHFLSIDVWSALPGRRQVLAVADAVRATLDGAALTLLDHQLVDLRFVSVAVIRDADDEGFRATLRFRAATEPL